jgi:signal transduction histidine kinase
VCRTLLRVLHLTGMVLLLCAWRPAQAGDLIREVAYVEDPGGSMTIEQVQGAHFQAVNRAVYLGYTRSTVWVRLTVDVPADAARLALSVLPATLDRLDLVHPDGRVTPLPGHVNWIAPAPGHGHLFLRAQTQGSMQVSPALMTEGAWRQEEADRKLMLGIFIGSFLFALAMVVLMFVTMPDPLYLYCLLHVHVLGLVSLNAFGYLYDFFAPVSTFDTAVAGNVLLLLSYFLTVLVIGAILQTLGMTQQGSRMAGTILAVQAALCVLFFAMDRQTVNIAGVAVNAAGLVTMIGLTVAVFRKPVKGRWLIAPLIVLSLLQGLRVCLTLVGLVEPAGWMVSQLAIRSATTMIMFVILLWLLHHRQQETLLQSLMTQQQWERQASHEAAARSAKDRLMMMLLHEFKNPLYIIQLASSSLSRRLRDGTEDARRLANIRHAVDDMNAIVERCVQADRIEMGRLATQAQRLSLDALIDDVVRSLDRDRIRLAVPSGIALHADGNHLRLILLNLLSNALKYSPAGSMVELHAVAAPACDGSVDITVVNQTGRAGVPDPAQLFTRYYRAETVRGVAGAGLGLWLAQSFAREAGTEIHFHGDQSRIAFSLRLPCLQEEPA